MASRNDPYVEIERAEAFARGWGSTFVDLGRAGHINVDSGHGPWPKGRALLRGLIHQVEAADTPSRSPAAAPLASGRVA